MTAPNITELTSLVGVTTYLVNVGTASTTILSNPANSDKLVRVISLSASNKTTGIVNVSASYVTSAVGTATSVAIVRNVSLPTGTTLIVVGRDTPLYLEEDRSLIVSSSVATGVDFVSSYELLG